MKCSISSLHFFIVFSYFFLFRTICELETVFTDLDEVTFTDYDTSIWTIEYGAVCWSDDPPDCIYSVTTCHAKSLLGGYYSLRDDSKVHGVLPLANNNGWVAYSKVKVCVDFWKIDSWFGLFWEWFINGNLI